MLPLPLSLPLLFTTSMALKLYAQFYPSFYTWLFLCVIAFYWLKNIVYEKLVDVKVKWHLIILPNRFDKSEWTTTKKAHSTLNDTLPIVVIVVVCRHLKDLLLEIMQQTKYMKLFLEFVGNFFISHPIRESLFKRQISFCFSTISHSHVVPLML